MLRHRYRHDDDALVDSTEEERIRSDERSRVEEELRTLGGEQHVSRTRTVSRPYGSDRIADVPRDTGRVHGDGTMVTEDVRDRDDRVVVQRDEPVEVVRTRTFSIGQLLAVLVGAALVALGVVALVQTGVDTPLSEPVEPVLGWDHTPWLGILEVAAGALLMLFALRPGGRWLVAFVGAALVAGGVLIVSELDWTVEELGAEEGFGWVAIIAGALAILASLLTPRRYERVAGTPVIG
jgi:hypothetical protein